MQSSDGYIGVFDSGVGGVSVLKRLVQLMPHERFLFFGDSANAPYGDKPTEWVLRRSERIVEGMLANGAKAIVIACNTATSVAAADMRERWSEVPIIGVEPALKPACESTPRGRILVMATETTIKLDKFHRLAHTYGAQSDIITVPCRGLADLIETGKLEGREMRDLLERYLAGYRGAVDSVVLGCTHYPFAAKQILAIVGNVPLYDGGPGTARQTRRILEGAGMLADRSQRGSVTFRSSGTAPCQIDLYRRFYQMPLP
jgi:glutamate racemase